VNHPTVLRGDWGWRAFGAPILALLTIFAFAVPAAEGRTFLRGFAEPAFESESSADRTHWYDESVRANANLARINVNWRNITSGAPALPTNPNDPAYRFGRTDGAVLDAAGRGQRILITVFGAPEFAEGANQPGDAPEGTWKPDPAKVGEFAQALATRYSGSFTAVGVGTLPRVAYFEAWNEPNLSDYLTPQSTDGKLFAPDHYREMLNAFQAGTAGASPEAQVVAGGTAPYGDEIGGRRTRPLAFFRDLMCLNRKLKATGCKDKAQFDIVSHHPITFEKSPRYSAISPDDVTIVDFKNLVKTLRAAEKHNTIGGPKRHPAWASEFWWESRPPDNQFGVPVSKHARWLELSMYLLWKQGADAAIWLRLWDDPIAEDEFSGEQSGVFFQDRTEKPAFKAFRFPFVADRTSKKKVNVWTIAPADGTVAIQKQRGGGYKTIDRVSVSDGVPEQTKVKVKGKQKLRGALGGETSLPYTAK
jgi:hypothetical protein